MDSNPYAPPMAPPPPSEGSQSASIHRIVNAALLIAGAPLGALMLLYELHHFPLPRSATGNDDEAFGGLVAATFLVVWSFAALTWGPLVAYGLLTMRTWAAREARGYWLLSLFSCMFTLPAIYGLVSTTRPTFKALFARK